MGTVGYMAPEQIEGGEADQRADIFSLGVVLYQALTGQQPLRRPSVVDTLHAILHDEPPALAPQIPIGVQQILARCLQKQPDARFQSARDLEFALATVDSHGTASPATWVSSRLTGRARLALIAGLVILVAAAAWVLVRRNASPGGGDTESIRSIAVLPLEDLSQAHDQEYLADSLNDALITNLSQIEALRVIGRTSVMRYKGTKRPLQELSRELGVTGIVEGTIQRVGDRVRVGPVSCTPAPDSTYEAGKTVQSGVRRPAGPAVRARRHHRQPHRGAGHATRALPPGESRRADRAWVDSGALPAWQVLLEQPIHSRCNWRSKLSRARSRRIQPPLAPGLAWRTRTSIWDCVRPHASGRRDATWTRRRPQGARAGSDLAEAHTSLGLIQLFYDWDREAAFASLRRALQLNPGYVVAHRAMAAALLLDRRPHEAIEHSKQAVQLDPVSLAENYFLSLCYIAARDYAAAESTARRSLELEPRHAAASKSSAIFDRERRRGQGRRTLRRIGQDLRLFARAPCALDESLQEWRFEGLSRS